MPSKDSSVAKAIRPRIRVTLGKEVALGPGKVELLGHVLATGSLNQAAKRMEMSYMRAWTLVKVMNRSFREPLIRMERGGSGGGRAVLTECGQKVLRLYQEMDRASLEAVKAPWKAMRALLANPA